MVSTSLTDKQIAAFEYSQAQQMKNLLYLQLHYPKQNSKTVEEFRAIQRKESEQWLKDSLGS